MGEMTQDLNRPRTELEQRLSKRLGEPFVCEIDRALARTDPFKRHCIELIQDRKLEELLAAQNKRDHVTVHEAEQCGAGYAGATYTDQLSAELLLMLRTFPLERVRRDLDLAKSWCLLHINKQDIDAAA
jgi:hypothetical protein